MKSTVWSLLQRASGVSPKPLVAKIRFRRICSLGPLWLILLSLIAFSGCATGPKGPSYSAMKTTGEFAPRPGKGLLLIYGVELPWGLRFHVYANDTLVTESMTGDRFISYFADSGPLHLSSTGNSGDTLTENLVNGPILTMIWRKKDRLVLDVKPGETYYIKLEKGAIREKMSLMDKDKGEKEIANSHCINPHSASPVSPP